MMISLIPSCVGQPCRTNLSAHQCTLGTHTCTQTTDVFQLTWLADVIGLRVAVRCVAHRRIVGVRGQLMIQLLRAVDKNGQMLHLVKVNIYRYLELSQKKNKSDSPKQGQSYR